MLHDRVIAALRGSTAGVMGVRVDVGGLGTVVARNPDLGLPPASTQKLFTGATVLDRLGAGTRLRTRFRLDGQRFGHRLVGRLVIVGGGDPILTSGKLRAVARAVRRWGVTSVTGGVLVDAGRYDGAHAAEGWKANWVPEESGALSAIVVDGNDWSTTAARYPALAAGYLMRRLLRSAGVAVGGDVTVGAVTALPAGSTAWSYTTVSPPLGTVVAAMLKDSVNLYAEQLLKELAARTSGIGTTAAGIDVIRAQGDALGVPITTPLADGSGLSALDQHTVATEVAWLEAVRDSALGTDFRRSLPLACVDGTLEQRMCGTAAAGRAWAKTGTLDGVRCLAGYTWTRSGRRVTFAFLLARASYGPSATAAIDRAVVALASSTA